MAASAFLVEELQHRIKLVLTNRSERNALLTVGGFTSCGSIKQRSEPWEGNGGSRFVYPFSPAATP